MGNREAIEALNNGTEAWKAYVAENGKPEVLQGSVHGADLSGADLSNIDAGPAGLRFNKCELPEANLSEVSGDISVSHSNLDGASFQNADLSEFKVIHSDAQGVNLKDSYLHGADFNHVDMSNSDLSLARTDNAGAIMGSVAFRDVNLDGANLDGAKLPSARFENSHANGASMKGAVFDNGSADWLEVKGSDLTGAHLNGMVAKNCDFSGSDMSGIKANAGPNMVRMGSGVVEQIPVDASFEKVNFEGAVLKNAELKGANLNQANMKGADLEGADVTGAVTSKMKVDGDTKMEGAKGLNQETLDKADPKLEPNSVERGHASVGEESKDYVNQGTGEILTASVDKDTPDPNISAALRSEDPLSASGNHLSGIFEDNSARQIGDPGVTIGVPAEDIATTTPTLDTPPPEMPAYAAPADYQPSGTMAV